MKDGVRKWETVCPVAFCIKNACRFGRHGEECAVAFKFSFS